MADFGEGCTNGNAVEGVGCPSTTARTHGIAQFAASVALNNSVGGPAVNAGTIRESGLQHGK